MTNTQHVALFGLILLSIVIILAAARAVYEWYLPFINVRIIKIDKVEFVFPLRGSMKGVYAMKGRNFTIHKDNVLPNNRQAVTVLSIFDIPEIKDNEVQQPDYIVRACDHTILRFRHDKELRAWRTDKPLTEKFV